jgi:hypothetical protein
MKRLVLLALCAACNQVLGVEATALVPDAPPPADTDGDGTADIDDNCPLANDQNDEDDDGVGDVCDNCPLVANPKQESGGDQDLVGDACDPRPDVTGDCLVVFDAFSAPDTFAAHWQPFVFSGEVPAIEAQPGHVRIDGPATTPVTIVAKADDGTPFAGLFDVQVLAGGTLTTGSVEAVTRASDYRTGYSCGLRGYAAPAEQTIVIGQYSATSSEQASAKLSTEATGSTSLVRLFAPRGSGANEPAIFCITEVGSAAGVLAVNLDSTFDPPPGGGAGVRVREDVIDVSAVALYRFDPASCAPPIYR